jgi:hypothetical protein
VSSRGGRVSSRGGRVSSRGGRVSSKGGRVRIAACFNTLSMGATAAASLGDTSLEAQ